MTQWKRARRPEQKEERHTAILDAAAELFRTRAMAEITISAIAEGAGLAKGSVYRYFATKEEVLLSVLDRELITWFSEVDEKLRALAGRGTAESVAAILIPSVASRELMTQLLSRLAGDLEQNLSIETARGFKEQLLQRVGVTGGLIDAAFPAFPMGAGARFVMWLQVLISGIWPLANPVGAVREVMTLPAMAPLKVEFVPELERMAVVLLRGLSQEQTSWELESTS